MTPPTATRAAASDIEAVEAALEILLTRAQRLEGLCADAWRWSSEERLRVVALLDDVLERLVAMRAELVAAGR